VSGSGISWAICKSAPRSRQITTPAPHHSVFYRPDGLPATQPTASKHWKMTQNYTLSLPADHRPNVVSNLNKWAEHNVLPQQCIKYLNTPPETGLRVWRRSCQTFLTDFWDFSKMFRQHRNLYLQFRLQIFRRLIRIFSHFFLCCFYFLFKVHVNFSSMTFFSFYRD